MRKFVIQSFIFLCPILAVLLFIEYDLQNQEFPETIKHKALTEQIDELEILFLGSSQIERAINPEYVSRPAMNLANSSQRLYENFQLLKNFRPKLAPLKVVVLELSYDMLDRDPSFTSNIIHHKNLLFLKVNTFGRSLRPNDKVLFSADPEYFSDYLLRQWSKKPQENFNEYGFDTSKYEGSYSVAKFQDSLLKDGDIFIENVQNPQAYKENLQLLHQFLQYCQKQDLKVLIYHPPTHARYNALRNQELLQKWQNLILDLKQEYPEISFFIEDENPDFKMKHFYNGNHLNPVGAKKATRAVDQILEQEFFQAQP